MANKSYKWKFEFQKIEGAVLADKIEVEVIAETEADAWDKVADQTADQGNIRYTGVFGKTELSAAEQKALAEKAAAGKDK